jgi:hypothetical protein
MQLQFTVESGSASIDDLFVDPFLSKSLGVTPIRSAAWSRSTSWDYR